jgi:hypothetical protein
MPPLAPLAPRLIWSEVGQASVELVAVVPFVLLCAAVAWQLALVGQTVWLCANAARVAARAEAVGGDGEAAARSALPKPYRDGLEVSRRAGGAMRVRVHIPLGRESGTEGRRLLLLAPGAAVTTATGGQREGAPLIGRSPPQAKKERARSATSSGRSSAMK